MRQDIYSGLSRGAQKLVDEIENCVGYEIQVRTISERGSDFIAECKENTVGLISGPESIVIESPTDSLDDITEEAFVHELLHARRSYVQAVPHLWPRKKIDGAAAAAIDNWLEHAIIYERQIELCPGLNAD